MQYEKPTQAPPGALSFVDRSRHRLFGSRRRVIQTILVIVAIIGLGWLVRPRPAIQPAGPGGRNGGPMPVATATAQTGAIAITLTELGTVTPLATVTVRTQIAGQLTEIAFREGQMVKKGDFLAQIDPRPYQHALAQAEGQLARDRALLREAELDLTRYRTLLAQDSIARQQVDAQDALVHQYQGTVATDEGVVGTANLNLIYCHITAPSSGRVGLRQVDQGNYVTPSDTNGIVVLTQLQPISVIFTIPEDNLGPVMARLHSGAALAVNAYDRTQTTKLASGTLETVDNQIDVTTGTVKLRALFGNDDQTLFPAQFVNVVLVVDTLKGVTVAPSAAIQRGEPGTFVYVVRPDSTVAVRPVKLGPADGDRVQIVSGLQPGETVVTDGADRLRDGGKVILPAAAGASDGATPRKGRRQRAPAE